MIRCINARHVIQGDEWNLLILELLKLTRFPARIKAKTLSSVMSGLFQTYANIKIILISRNLFPFSGVFRNKCRKNEGLFPKWGVFRNKRAGERREGAPKDPHFARLAGNVPVPILFF